VNKLKIKLQRCYGIKNLETEIDFSKDRACVIYASNGSMKTSFAKTFKDLSNNVASKDLIFPDRITTREIKGDTDVELSSSSVFVIEPYNAGFKSDKESTLLIRKELKEEYDAIYKELDLQKVEFVKKLKLVSQSSDCESELLTAFFDEQSTFFEIITHISPKLDGKQSKYDFKYNDIFDKKGNVKKFLDKHTDSLESYISNYDSLISNSDFFSKSGNSFGTYQAGALVDSTSDNSFFDAGHTILLNNNTKVTKADALKKLVDEEINRVVSDKKLKVIFEKVDKAIGSNTELRSFKQAIEQNNLLLVELKNYEEFKKKVWIGYLDQLTNEVNPLVSLYNSKKQELERIVSEAKEGITEWESSIKDFNERFIGLPFKLSIINKEDVILKTDTPTVGFIFFENEEEKTVEKNDLLEVLSQGERRALYLLNIIFEVQGRKKSEQKTLFIIDDIADSFDYKNKYAIIEYLKDISDDLNFYQIILTHNFDFFRTLESRLVGRCNCKMVIKSENKVELVPAEYLKPFDYFKKNIGTDNNILIASIPFVRNLAEYSGHITELNSLTSLLHIKTDTASITVLDLEKVIKSILVDKQDLDLSNGQMKVIDLIFNQADSIVQDGTDQTKLESKIVLSIAIRLKAEQFLIDNIDDETFIEEIARNQTFQLIEKYKKSFPEKRNNIILFDQVNLMTPENIHLNSFMYEPIIDLGIDHLKILYGNVGTLSQESLHEKLTQNDPNPHTIQ